MGCQGFPLCLWSTASISFPWALRTDVTGSSISPDVYCMETPLHAGFTSAQDSRDATVHLSPCSLLRIGLLVPAIQLPWTLSSGSSIWDSFGLLLGYKLPRVCLKILHGAKSELSQKSVVISPLSQCHVLPDTQYLNRGFLNIAYF